MNQDLLKQAVMQKLALKNPFAGLGKRLKDLRFSGNVLQAPKGMAKGSPAFPAIKSTPGKAQIPSTSGVTPTPVPDLPPSAAQSGLKPPVHYDAAANRMGPPGAAPIPPPASAAPQPWQKTPNIDIQLPYTRGSASGKPLYFDKPMNTQTMMGDFYQGSSTMNPKLLKGPRWGSPAGYEMYGAQGLGQHGRPAAERIARLNSAGLGPLQAPSLAEHL